MKFTNQISTRTSHKWLYNYYYLSRDALFWVNKCTIILVQTRLYGHDDGLQFIDILSNIWLWIDCLFFLELKWWIAYMYQNTLEFSYFIALFFLKRQKTKVIKNRCQHLWGEKTKYYFLKTTAIDLNLYFLPQNKKKKINYFVILYFTLMPFLWILILVVKRLVFILSSKVKLPLFRVFTSAMNREKLKIKRQC